MGFYLEIFYFLSIRKKHVNESLTQLSVFFQKNIAKIKYSEYNALNFDNILMGNKS